MFNLYGIKMCVTCHAGFEIHRAGCLLNPGGEAYQALQPSAQKNRVSAGTEGFTVATLEKVAKVLRVNARDVST
jgi:hypothetical protein